MTPGGRERGVSLLEILVGATLGIFVVLGMQVAWWNSTKAVAQATSQLDVQRDAAFALASMADAARRAATVTIADYGTGAANLLVVKNGAGTELHRFYWDPSANKLYAAAGGAAPAVFVSSNVQSLSFALSNKELGMQLVLVDAFAQTAPFATTAWLRN